MEINAIIKNFKNAVYKWTEAEYILQEMNKFVDLSDECAELFDYDAWIENKSYGTNTFMKLHEQIEDTFFTARDIKSESEKELNEMLVITLNSPAAMKKLEIKIKEPILKTDAENIIDYITDDFSYNYNQPDQLQWFVKVLNEALEKDIG